MPRKEFESFTRLDASDVNTYLMDQSVMSFAGTAARGSAIPTPVEGMVTYLNDSNSVQVYDGGGWTAAGGVSSGNFVINGAFDFWQRGTTFGGTALIYTADRWRLSAETDQPTARTISRATFTPGELSVAGFGDPQAYFRSTLTTVGTSTGVITAQRIENVQTLAGQTATLSFWAKSDSSRTQTVEMQQTFAGGSSTVTFGSNTFNTTTAWQRFIFTVSVPDLAGKIFGDVGSPFLGISFKQALANDSVLDLWGVQLEAGPVATPFRRNANSLQGELAACQRYFQTYGGNVTNQIIANGNGHSSNQAFVFLPLRPEMRGTPSFSSGPVGSFRLHAFGIFNSTATAVTPIVLSKTSLGINITSGSGWTSGDSVMFESTAADGVVNISAEL
jgi:hypothetical protein